TFFNRNTRHNIIYFLYIYRFPINGSFQSFSIDKWHDEMTRRVSFHINLVVIIFIVKLNILIFTLLYIIFYSLIIFFFILFNIYIICFFFYFFLFFIFIIYLF